MSLEISILGSGSKGNSIYVSNGETSILIDAGFSGKETEKRLQSQGLSLENIDAILISHEHSDHINGAGVLCRKMDIPLYITYDTYQYAENKINKIPNKKYFESGKEFEINSLKIKPFAISHDAVDPVSFSIYEKNMKVSITTDLGFATNLVKENIKNSNMLILEANHDLTMLENGPYEWELKQRIKSKKGHLSNEDAKNLIEEVINEKLAFVVLGHLSEENNLPEKAYKEVKKAIPNGKTKLLVASQYYASNLFVL